MAKLGKTKRSSYPEQYGPYKLPFVCLNCRKTYHRSWFDYGVDGSWSEWRQWAKEASVCPQCGARTYYAGKAFKSPPKKDRRAWEIVEALLLKGFVFERGLENLTVPTKLDQVPAFLQKIRASYSLSYTFIFENLDTVPFPGFKLSANLSKVMCEAFLAKYHRGPRDRIFQGKRAPRLTWLTFEEATYIRLENVGNAIFTQPAFRNATSLYFMIWNWGDNLYEATSQQIQQFLESKPPWQDADYYVFPQTLEWCIVFTHEDQVFITGSFPKNDHFKGDQTT